MSAPRRRVTVIHYGAPCQAVYRPQDITLAMADLAGTNALAAAVAIIVGSVAAWDLFDGEQPYPITEGSVLDLPAPFVTQLGETIANDYCQWLKEQAKEEAA